MFAKTVIAVSFAALAVAVPTSSGKPGGSKQCQTSEQQCCNSVQKSSDSGISALLGLLNVVADVDALVGVTCSPISVVGLGGACGQSQQPVCCNNNSFNGVIALGCTPINL